MSTSEVDKEIADMGFHRTEGEEETQTHQDDDKQDEGREEEA